MTSQRDTPEPADYAAADPSRRSGLCSKATDRCHQRGGGTLARRAVPGPRRQQRCTTWIQSGPLAIDLTLLGNSDAVDLPGERLLVSAWLAALLPTGRGSGIGCGPCWMRPPGNRRTGPAS